MYSGYYPSGMPPTTGGAGFYPTGSGSMQPWNQLEQRVTRLEHQLRRLEARISRLETPFGDTTTPSLEQWQTTQPLAQEGAYSPSMHVM
ncbi:MAG: hypothetical protein ACOXZW_01460 [Bacilli bacterium]|jgi:hypothetical protein